MYYNFFRPHKELADHVMFIWSLEYKHTQNKHCNVRIVPTACTELIFYFGDIVKIVDKSGNQQVKSYGIISGQKTNYFDYVGGSYSGVIALALKPAGTRALLGLPASEVANLHIDASDILGKETDTIKEKVYLAKNTFERIEIIQQFLISFLYKRESLDKRIIEFVNRVTDSGGLIKINNLAHKLNIGRRQLERCVASNIGLSPKEFVKVIRFQKTLSLKQKDNSLSLTQLAYAAGYSDQAHFTNDFKSLTGLTPSKYFSECQAFSDYYTFL